jgi:hypothetical protein
MGSSRRFFSGRVAFAGSRSLGPWAAGLVGSVVRAAAASGASVGVGCCRGADHLVLSAALPALLPVSVRRLRVFAAFGPGGAGALPSASPSLVLAAAGSGVPVSWWAGGGLRVPPRARLARRSRALVSWAAAGPGPGAFVCFLASPVSRGSLRAAAFAASLGLPVLAFPVGCLSPVPPLASPAPPGRWSRVSGLGPGVPPAWLWAPDQAPLTEQEV